MTKPPDRELARHSKATLEALTKIKKHLPRDIQAQGLRESTAEKVRRRQRASRAADASLRLEGMEASDEAKALGERWIQGKLTTDELVEQTKARHLAKSRG